MEINIKIEGEEIPLKVKMIELADEPNAAIMEFTSVDDGRLVFKLQYKDDVIKILEQSLEFTPDIPMLQDKLEELLIQMNPQEMFGTEDTETGDNDIETPYDPEKIRVDTKPFSLRQIYDMIKVGDIDLTPDFQRNLVWDSLRKSRLIESILLRIPLPMFYFAQDEEDRISVVDGLQRLSTIREFMDNEFPLRNLEYLENKVGGRYYSNPDPKKAIDTRYYRRLNMTQITVNVIDPSSPFKLKYDIFKRINTGGQPLNSQEIRNCLASKSLRQALREMAKLDSFKQATGWSIKDVRMEAQELALRFILFHQKYKSDKTLNNYSGNIESELNELTEVLSKEKKYDFSEYINLFDNAMKNANYLFGRYSFRKCQIDHLAPGSRRQQINKALFVSWSVLLSQFKYEEIREKYSVEMLALPLAERVSEDLEFFMFLTYSTNSKVNIQAVFKVVDEIINEKLN